MKMTFIIETCRVTLRMLDNAISIGLDARAGSLITIKRSWRSLLLLGESNVIWKESNRIITAGDIIIRKDDRLHLQNGYNLRIDDLREQDTGEYVCEIETFGSPIHQTSRLEILGKQATLNFKIRFC